MFYVWDVSGSRRSYEPGQIRKTRRVEATKAAHSIEGPSKQQDFDEEDGYTASIIRKYSDSEAALKKRETVMVAEQIMSSPVFTLPKSSSIHSAWQAMCRYRFRHIPVVDGSNALCGILSDRDVLLAAQAGTNENPISQHMASNVLVAHKGVQIREIARVLVEERIGAMPLVDQDELLVGILTRTDILRAVVRHAPMKLWI